jgi:hypothetical protein
MNIEKHTIIEEVLTRNEFKENPPILIDIGASGGTNSKWKDIAKYSVCIAFDADDRKLDETKKESSIYKKLYLYDRLVSDKPNQECDFYLTKSPYCSSLLEPNQENLKNWYFSNLFKVEKVSKHQTIDILTILKERNINKIDWFKVDSQGIDLRLIKSIGESKFKKVLVAELEPGIMSSSYHHEEHLYSIMEYMDRNGFWMSDMVVKGTQRLNRPSTDKYFDDFSKIIIPTVLKKSPGWAEVTYMNPLSASLDMRDHLLSWVFAIIEEQYGFALEVLEKAFERFQDAFFKYLTKETLRMIDEQLSQSKVYQEYTQGHIIPIALDGIERLKEINKTRDIKVFGAGSFGAEVISFLKEHDIIVTNVFDNDKNKWGDKVEGVLIVSPENLTDHSVTLIASTWHEEVSRQLEIKGFRKGQDFMIAFK